MYSFVCNQVCAFSEALNNKIMPFRSSIDILDVIGGSFKVTGGIVALWDEDIVIDTTL